MMRILVTDGDTRPALACVRALGRAGHEVIVGSERFPSLASASRFCSFRSDYRSPHQRPEQFLEDVARIARAQRADAVFPITEVSTLLLAENRSVLPADCELPFAAGKTIALASDKAEVAALAESVGVPTPTTWVVHNASLDSATVARLSYPVVVKPARSRVRGAFGWISTGVSYATDASSLARTLRGLAPEVFPVLLQERIEGPGRGVFTCFDRGQPVAFFSHLRLREKPPSGGVSVLCESTPVDPIAQDYATRLLKRLDWHGVAMVEFKEDRRDGSLKLMEINARFWGSLQLAIDAGVNFPCILADLAAGDRPAEAPPYRIGIQSRWLAGDIDAMLMTLLRSRERLNLPPGHANRWSVLKSFLHFRGANLHYEVESLDDPGPGRLEWRRRLTGG